MEESGVMSNKYLNYYNNPECNILYDEGYLDALDSIASAKITDKELEEAKNYIVQRLGVL